MASKTIVRLIDDVDGSEAAETVRFSMDAVAYEIDLNTANAAVLRSVLAPYIAAGRKTSTVRIVRAQAGASRAPANRDENQRIRQWAAQTGRVLKPRGRIPAQVVEAYRAAA